jgi:hypothetical protein
MLNIAVLATTALLSLSTGLFIGWIKFYLDPSSRILVKLGEQARTMGDLSASLVEQTAKTAEASALAADEHKKRVQVVECIAVIENDRNGWRDRYWECGLGHSAAQELLMREIMRLRRVLDKNSIKYTANSACGQLVDDFSRRHTPPETSNRIDHGEVAKTPVNPVDPTAQ